jgi:hypothetical protein
LSTAAVESNLDHRAVASRFILSSARRMPLNTQSARFESRFFCGL